MWGRETAERLILIWIFAQWRNPCLTASLVKRKCSSFPQKVEQQSTHPPPPTATHHHRQGSDSPCPSARLWQLFELWGRTRWYAAPAAPAVGSWRATRMGKARLWPSSQTWWSSGPLKRQKYKHLHQCWRRSEVCRGARWTLSPQWRDLELHYPPGLSGEWPVTFMSPVTRWCQQTQVPSQRCGFQLWWLRRQRKLYHPPTPRHWI